MRANLLLRVGLYYAVLLAVFVGLTSRFGDQLLVFAPVASLAGGRRGAASILSDQGVTAIGASDTAMSTAVSMVVAALLSLPVAWLYILTRQKKGYRQSVVQTLVLLPVVVAGVVVLVKNSVALAFSLAGIVAAVRFRNTLEDSKDAVYIFLVTAVGLAAGVQPMVAIVFSITFNLIAVALWSSDFGRSPAALEGNRAERQLERAMQIVNRTGMFVAKMDDEVLKSMSPEQLDALADRAWRRKKRNAPELEDEAVARPSFDTLVRVRVHDVPGAREVAERVLGVQAKSWRLGGVVHEDADTHVLEYECVLNKTASPATLRDAMRNERILGIEIH
ncbi:MAG: DUF4956 domain-containing protein [Gemmatimonadota bacterium]|nr:DUF4956 domain-containing protein [Gemmatimonadota bacterium]